MTPERQNTRLKESIGLTRELTEVERQRLDLMRSIEGSMESGFMAMVEGTKSVKDAFRSMARDIIAELYRVFVVKQIVGAISGAASLAAFGLGSFRSSGGTVMPGESYIVGEKGPEIIKPRHSGTVVPAHMSSQGGTSNFTQNLSINVTGSDAANVRMEVAKMIPQITEATKAAVIDARRRGGQMRAAFG
jgi:phage-related minor tail protein